VGSSRLALSSLILFTAFIGFKVLQTPHPAGFLSGTTPFNALIGRRKGASAHCSLSPDPRKFGLA
jgi:hypothetical protein